MSLLAIVTQILAVKCAHLAQSQKLFFEPINTTDHARAHFFAPTGLLTCTVDSRTKSHKTLRRSSSVTMPPKEMKPKKWSSRCKAYKDLKDGLQDGSIDSGMKPKDIHESNPEFMKYPLSSFRSALNRMKSELGCHVRDDGKLHSTRRHWRHQL